MAAHLGKNPMAIDKREYAKERQGWSIGNLTGFRRTAEQIEDAQYDDLREMSDRYEKKKRFFGTIAVITLAILTWRFFFS